MSIPEKIEAALDERTAKLETCPVRKKCIGDKPCPKCGATTAGPCWINVEADAAFVDAIKELAAFNLEKRG